MDKKRKVEYWECNPDAEILTHEDIDAAIEAFMDESIDFPQGQWPAKLTVFGHARMEPSLMPGGALERVLEELDEELGNPDGDYTKPTELMKKAEDVFYAVVISEYSPWACDMIEKREIDLMQWVKNNHPEWLE